MINLDKTKKTITEEPKKKEDKKTDSNEFSAQAQIASLIDQLTIQKLQFNIEVGKEVKIPSTLEEILIYCEYKLEEDFKDITELENWIEKHENIELKIAFREWKINWNKLTTSLASLAPPQTIKEKESTPHLFIPKEYIVDVHNHIIEEEIDTEEQEETDALLREFGIIQEK